MGSTVRPLRADAARNRALLLAAAKLEFAERGLDASVSDIAARAGVGKGTLFRHFATKDDLIASIVCDHVGVVVSKGQELLATPDPDKALFDLLAVVAADQQQQRDLSFLMRTAETHPAVAELRGQLFTVVDALVCRAQRDGTLRADITGADVILLSCAPNHVVGYLGNPPAGLWRRYLEVIFDGLRSEGAHPLTAPAPTALRR